MHRVFKRTLGIVGPAIIGHFENKSIAQYLFLENEVQAAVLVP